MKQVRTAVYRKYPKESIESMLRRFKKKVNNAGIMDDIKKNEFYEKPSVRRRKAKKFKRHA